MDGASIADYKEMIRVNRFVSNTRDTCWKLQPNQGDENWDLITYSDSDWAGDVENHISGN
jgi:hypothetical protein